MKNKILCYYNCGQVAQYQLKNEKWCCSKSQNSCPNVKRKNAASNSNTNKGIKMTSKFKDNLRVSRLGAGNPFYGKHHTEETKKYYSKIRKGKTRPPFTEEWKSKIKLNHARISGENHWNWKGGIACDPYCDAWADPEYKESIKERDRCQCLNPECNKTSSNLCVHHIDYNKKNCHPHNLITICFSCNSKANFDREWHQHWYSIVIYQRYLK